MPRAANIGVIALIIPVNIPIIPGINEPSIKTLNTLTALTTLETIETIFGNKAKNTPVNNIQESPKPLNAISKSKVIIPSMNSITPLTWSIILSTIAWNASGLIKSKAKPAKPANTPAVARAPETASPIPSAVFSAASAIRYNLSLAS